MSENDNLAIVRQSWDAWNAHDPDAWIKLLHETHVTESDTLPQPVRGHEGARAFIEMYIKAFPDLRFSIDQMIESGDYVITRYTATGTHKGDLAGILSTGRHAETHGCVVAEIKNGRVLRQWLYWDSAHLLRQLGVLPGA
jgi:steroid delta-isomerase-like uncharacterized protein